MSEVEKQFFETFGIEKLVSQRYHTSIYGSIGNCIEKAKEWSKETGIRIKNIEIASDESIYFDKVYYPQITDRILLELICILNDFEGIDVKATTVNELKEELLEQTIEPFKYPIAFEEYHEIEKLYHQVQALFKENN